MASALNPCFLILKAWLSQRAVVLSPPRLGTVWGPQLEGAWGLFSLRLSVAQTYMKLGILWHSFLSKPTALKVRLRGESTLCCS